MLFGIPAALPADLLHTLARMGHGDEIVLVDANYPAASDAAHTHLGKSLELIGRDLPEATADILALLPLDLFVDDPVSVMASPGSVMPSVHADIEALIASAPGAPHALATIERFDFYQRAQKAFAIVRTMERRPYGNVILKKGVLTPAGDIMSPDSAIAVN